MDSVKLHGAQVKDQYWYCAEWVFSGLGWFLWAVLRYQTLFTPLSAAWVQCRFRHAESPGKYRICQHNMLVHQLLTLMKKVCPHVKDRTCLFCLFQALLHERNRQAQMNCKVHQIRSTEPADISHHVLTILYNREAALGAGYGSQFA